MNRTAALMTVPGALLALVLGACGPAASPEEAAANEKILEGIREQLATEAGVVEVTAAYVDNVDSDARASVSVECDGCDVPALYDAALRAVWTSEITPLHAISLGVNDPASSQAKQDVLSVPAEEAELTRTYGERPVSSSADE